MKKKGWRAIAWLLTLAAVVCALLLLSGGVESFAARYAGVDLTGDVGGIGRANTYTHYLERHADAKRPDADIEIDLFAFTAEGDARVTENEAGEEKALYTGDNASVTWSVAVPEAGMYNVYIEYYAAPSRGVDVERELRVNGELPFAGADTLRFSRLWTDGGDVRMDNQGNEIRPTQVETFGWQSARCRDDMGYSIEPYQVYFEAGENTLSLVGVNEPMYLRRVALTGIREARAYADYIASAPEARMTDIGNAYLAKVQGEDAVLRSSPSLYARYDHSSSATEPYSVTSTVLNYIGGDPWNNAGQWIEWTFSVPEDGYYHITLKGRQNYQRGALSCRAVYIDGEIPFAELSSVAFLYQNAWNYKTLSDDAGTPYRFYLTAGEHTIRLEATLGDMGHILEQMEDGIYRLNQIYRKILVLTGVKPDLFRDYKLGNVYPDVIEAMALESKRLFKLVDDTVKTTGQKSDRIAVAQTLAFQLDTFVDDPDYITKQFVNFKDNITSLGTAMQNMSETKLDIDYIIISGEDAKIQRAAENFLTKLLHEIRSCVASYTVDYNALGDVYGKDEAAIEAWIVTGRDQSTILKTMIDDSFTPSTDIKVNVKLVDPNALLGAVVAGNGPDVVISVDSWHPVNYAMRGSAEDLRQFADIDSVLADFFPSAYAPMSLDGGVYALPETQVYSLLFYREDVLAEYGIKPPETWDELIAVLPTIQGNNMSVGIPYPDIAAPNLATYYSMIYQNGGALYDEKATRTLIADEPGVKAFEMYTSLYNDYGLPTVFDFVSRFRSGEMPLGVADYTTYNLLTVSAPEIRGLWDFTLIPGVLKTDENGAPYVDHAAHSQGVCCMMVKTDDETLKQNAWTFMKWWASAESQVRFGREIESVLGASARYATANVKALEQLAWSAKQLAVLKEQMAQTVGYREVAGGYSTSRHMTNAVRKVINKKFDPRETLLDYARTIDEEIRIKRAEIYLNEQ